MRHRRHLRFGQRGLSLPALALFALACALTLGGCAPPGAHRKVRGMVRELAERELGPADKYEVQTSRDSLGALQAGRLEHVRVHGVNVRPAPGYVLDDLVVEARNVRVNRRAKTVESAEDSSAVGWIGEKNMAEMIAATGLVTDPTVRILADRVEVRGRYAVAGRLPLEVSARGRLTLKQPASVVFTADRVTAGGIPAPIPFSYTLDFRRIYEPLLLTHISQEPGRVTLNGTVDWSLFGRRARSTLPEE